MSDTITIFQVRLAESTPWVIQYPDERAFLGPMKDGATSREVIDKFRSITGDYDDHTIEVVALAKFPAPAHVFTFVSDELPDVHADTPYKTRAEALAFVQGFEYWDDGESIAMIWPFDALDLIAAIDAEIDADAIMVNVRARVAALGLEVP